MRYGKLVLMIQGVMQTASQQRHLGNLWPFAPLTLDQTGQYLLRNQTDVTLHVPISFSFALVIVLCVQSLALLTL